MKTDWNLKLLYKSVKDPAIERDVRAFELASERFANKYSGKDFTKSEGVLFLALKDSEKLLESSTSATRAYMYFMYRRELNSQDSSSESMLNRLTDRLTKAGNRTIFFDLKIGKVNKVMQRKFLNSKRLADYRYLLERAFEESKYQLTEAEEKILSLKSLPANSMWIDGVEKVVSKQTVRFKGKDLPIAEAINMVSMLPVKERRKLMKSTLEALKLVSDFSESEINAVFTNKKINDELRGFKKPYSATALSYENDEKSVEMLVKTVTNNFAVSRKFFELKKKLLNLTELTYADRAVGIGSTAKKIPYKNAYKIVYDAFKEFGVEYSDTLERMSKNGQIDVYPKKGKGGGAFCSSSIGLPTFVFLNQVNSFDSLMTLAHEMGHAIHGELSKEQKPIYQEYTTSVAETASTFFEEVVFDAVFKTLSKKDQIIALHDHIQSDIASIFRQIAFFNFENELHNLVRSAGMVPKEDIAKLLNKHMGAYMGKAVSITDLDGYFFVTVSHFRRPFYVYSYAYGQLISKALFARCKEDKKYGSEVRKFLSAGGSKNPKDIFGDIGINTNSSKIFQDGIKKIEEDIDKLKKLAG
ncbi:MAG: M3 family oligoendopeptidase [Parcubacteria group bacterium]|nr:M3 family oligoendopeptidase [Parcubacteria group bacterium]